MNKIYKVIFLGLSETEEFFKKRISFLGVSQEAAEEIIKKAPVVLKENESLDYLRRYATAITRAGGNVNIHACSVTGFAENKCLDIPTMASFTQCPQCGFKQLKKEECVKCGMTFTKG